MKNKATEKSATYETGNQDAKLPVGVATSEWKVATKAVGKRLQKAREAIGFTQPGLAAVYGGSKPGIQDNEAGNSMPGGKLLTALSRLGVNVNWVLTGEGDMLQAESGAAAGAFNSDALTAIIYALLKARPGEPDPDYIARSAVEAYQRYVAAGVITATGISPKGSKAA